MNELTPEELKATRTAVRNALELRRRHLKTVTPADKKMERQQGRMRQEVQLLNSAYRKLAQ